MKIKRAVTDALCQLAGLCFFSLSVNMFAVPGGIVQGGLTGVATVINHLFPFVPVGTGVFVMNIPLFILALVLLKRDFLIKTLVLTLAFALFIDAGALFIPAYEGDRLLGAVFCGVFSGLGLALVFYTGATTGGTDIIARLIKRARPDYSMGRLMLLLDSAVIGLSLVAYGELEAVMYALICVFVTSRVIDTVLYGYEHSRVIFTVSDKSEEIARMLMQDFARGVTIVRAVGGYTGEEKNIVWCAARASQTRNIISSVRQTDPKAFTVVCEAGEIIGSGFESK